MPIRRDGTTLTHTLNAASQETICCHVTISAAAFPLLNAMVHSLIVLPLLEAIASLRSKDLLQVFHIMNQR